MTRFATLAKAAAATLALAAGLTLAASPASAGRHYYGYYGPGYYYGPSYNGAAVAAGVAGGLIVGGMAAAAYNDPHCWMETRKFYTKKGNVYFRDVRVCR